MVNRAVEGPGPWGLSYMGGHLCLLSEYAGLISPRHRWLPGLVLLSCASGLAGLGWCILCSSCGLGSRTQDPGCRLQVMLGESRAFVQSCSPGPVDVGCL